MKIISTATYEEMSEKAAGLVLAKLAAKPDSTLGLATGSTPKGLYSQLAADHRENQTSYERVTTINLDEYIGLPAADPNSYLSFMQQHLFRHIDIPASHIHLPNGEAKDLEQECSRYEALIDETGIDLQILGIGENGHIGFNEPGTPFNRLTHVTNLAASTIEANARFFSSAEEVPKQAITMGIASIMKSKEILLLASGKQKADAVRRLLAGGVSEDFPASVLHAHPHVTILADDEALSPEK